MLPLMDKVMPEVWQAAVAFSSAVREGATQRGLSAQESELIKVRASQINGCAFCLDLHSREARQSGIPQQTLDLLPAWRETEVFSERGVRPRDADGKLTENHTWRVAGPASAPDTSACTSRSAS